MKYSSIVFETKTLAQTELTAKKAFSSNAVFVGTSKKIAGRECFGAVKWDVVVAKKIVLEKWSRIL